MPSSRPTQEFVPIKEIRDGLIVLKDGGIRAVLLASSVNMALKSYDERQALYYNYQAFLNSIDFSLQILTQSRRYDILPYLSVLDDRQKEELEPLMKVQIREYIEFIRGFTDTHNIMQKRFYIIVPYTSSLSNQSMSSILPSNPFKKTDDKKEKADEAAIFEEKRSQLEQRLAVIISGLKRVGVRAVQLGSDELVELFHKSFNPGDNARGIVEK
ncbi:MAG TPA: hypothetical protein PK886_01855 [Candidatus Paceibacterota bacterium]|nr:hypothetical protein [Candidatus Paceibacterota bacterium]